MDQIIRLGKYQHFKGNFYEVIGVARLESTLEELVIYKALYESPEYGKDALWARLKTVFLEMVEVNGQTVPRFKYVGDDGASPSDSNYSNKS